MPEDNNKQVKKPFKGVSHDNLNSTHTEFNSLGSSSLASRHARWYARGCYPSKQANIRRTRIRNQWSRGKFHHFIFIYFFLPRAKSLTSIWNFRSPKKWKHIWIKNGNHLGTYSLVNHSVATLFTRKIDSFTSLSNKLKSLS